MARNKFRQWIVMEDGARLALAKSGALAYVRGTAAERDAWLAYAALANMPTLAYLDLTSKLIGLPYQTDPDDPMVKHFIFAAFRTMFTNGIYKVGSRVHIARGYVPRLAAMQVFVPFIDDATELRKERYERSIEFV